MNIKIHKNLHLGDIINVIQSNLDSEEIICKDRCVCCNSDSYEMASFIADLLGIKNKIKKNSVNNYNLKMPTWVQDIPNKMETISWYSKPYKKAININYKKNNSIVCQFDFRSGKNKDIPNLFKNKIIQSFKSKLVNIGDNPHLDIINLNGYDLKTKWEAICKAKCYIGIDSGLSHLALMSNTPVYIVYKNHYCPWFFYPENTRFFNQPDQLIDLIKSEILSISSKLYL